MTFVRKCATAWAPLLAATVGAAQQPAPPATETPVASELETWVAPVVAQRRAPDYPLSELQTGGEGWVAMSFIVTKDGAVAEAMIEDSSGNADIDRAALAAIRKWRYTPATRNGEPVDHPMTDIVIRMQLEGEEHGASKDFVRKYKEINALMAAGDLPKAEQLFELLRNQGRRNLYEDAWYWSLRYTLLTAKNSSDTDELEKCLSRAVGRDIDYLPPDMFVSAAAHLFVLRVQNNDLGGALAAYQRLTDSKTAKKSKDFERVVALLDTNVRKIREGIATAATILNAARVGSHEYWVHSLVRRSFSLGDIRGHLQTLEVRCQHHNVTYVPVTDQHTWTVPTSWEKCGVYVKGAPGDAFKFYEYPDRS